MVVSLPKQSIAVENGQLTLYSGIFNDQELNELFKRLLEETRWRQPQIRIAGKSIKIPRLQAWYGDAMAHYHYSGLSLKPEEWTETLLLIKTRVEKISGAKFNSLLLNRYRNGQDSVGWHSDDERELGANPIIASLSLGATRVFRLQHKKQAEVKLNLELKQGTLLMMSGELQHYWRHQAPKTSKPVGERINLTFRRIYL